MLIPGIRTYTCIRCQDAYEVEIPIVVGPHTHEYAEEVTFSTSKKIRGTAKTSNSVLSGLSTDIGASMLIDFTSVN